MKFEKLSISEEIKDNLREMGFLKTTDIQFKTIPAILNGEDVLAIAQTGTGKTAAFAIPIIDMIHSEKRSRRSGEIKSLVLVPTRELAQQIGQVFARLTKHTYARSFAIYGGIDQDPQIDQLDGGVDVLIATPGRMFDLIAQRFIDVSSVETLVLDEADHMLDLGFIKDIEAVKKKLPYKHQTLFFTATINKKIKKLAYAQIRSNALRIQIAPENMVSKNVNHFVSYVEMDQKRHLLTNFLTENSNSKVLVFVRTQVRSERVLAHLVKNKITAVAIHGGLEQSQRDDSIDSFRASECQVMIATDISARGIDLPGISHVVNYDIPDDPENYVHRVGRTGRGRSVGDAIAFCSPIEKEKLAQIEELIQIKIPTLKVDRVALKELPKNEIDTIEVGDILNFEEELEFGSQKKRKKKNRKKR